MPRSARLARGRFRRQVDQYVKGEPITGACEELRLFSLCSGMKWAHLPVAGGLYDQDPALLDAFSYIFQKVAENEQAENEKQRRESEKQTRKRSGAASPRSTRIKNR